MAKRGFKKFMGRVGKSALFKQASSAAKTLGKQAIKQALGAAMSKVGGRRRRRRRRH